MSSPIMPIEGPLGRAALKPTAGGVADEIGAFVSALAASDSASAIDVSRGAPPPEVLDQIAAAGRTHERLREGGHELRFQAAVPGGRTTIELHDRAGDSVRSLSASEAVEIADGRPLGEG